MCEVVDPRVRIKEVNTWDGGGKRGANAREGGERMRKAPGMHKAG